MDLLLVLQLATAALTLVLLALASFELPRAVRAWSALGVAVALIAVAYLAEARLLGHPRPAHLEFASMDARVLSVHAVEGKAINVWIVRDGSEVPLSLSLPWDEATARAAQAAQRQAEQRGTGTRMRFARRLTATEEEPMFYSPPQQVPAAKRGE